jgi:site-specific DNA-methyltransferase (adenine-specific)
MKVTDKITITQEDNMLLMSHYPDNYFDLAIVDPPYGINADKKQNEAGTIQSNGNYITIQKLIEEYLKEKGYGN